MAKKMAARKECAAGKPPLGMAESRRELDDLRAELEAARESFKSADGEAQSLAGASRRFDPVEKTTGPAKPGGARGSPAAS